MVPFWGCDRSHCNTVLYGTPSMVQHARMNFWYFLFFLRWNFLWEIFMHCFWIASVFRGAHQRSIFQCAADEETPRSRGEAPTTTHSLLSEASTVEKRDFDEATAFYNSAVWGHFWGISCAQCHLCALQIYLCALNVFAWNEAQIQQHSFWLLALNTMTGKRKQEKQNRKMTLCQCFLTNVTYANGNTSNMMLWYELALVFETVSFCFLLYVGGHCYLR